MKSDMHEKDGIDINENGYLVQFCVLSGSSCHCISNFLSNKSTL